MKETKVKSLVLLSGGLDSRLAAMLLREQCEVETVYFALPFGTGCCKPDCAFNFSQIQGFNMRIVDCTKGKLFSGYLNIVKKPRYGHGSAMNPCIDCRIFMLKKAKEIAKKINADIIATGEVLNERPMSQTMHALKIVENESSTSGILLRPLSAKLLPETEAEKKELINREKFLAIKGRNRRIQIELAKKYKISFPSPAGGCLLCEKEFAKKLKDLFKYKKHIMPKDIELLKIGRHFWVQEIKIIIGRNHEENLKLKNLKEKKDIIMEAKDIPSPVTLIIGKAAKNTIVKAAALTARYSDAKTDEVKIIYGKNKLNREIVVKRASQEEIEKLRV